MTSHSEPGAGIARDSAAGREAPGGGDLRTAVHDLRNVVAPLRNAVQLLRLRGKADPALAPVTDLIDRQVNEMIRVLDILAGGGEGRAAPEPVPATATATATAPATATAIARAPRADGRAEALVDALPPPAVRRILIVDDNVALLTSMSSVLREAGHGVQTAEDGSEALALAASWNPDFVLLDADIPRMNGFEVAKRLRSTYPQDAMTLVLMSGSSLDAATRRGAERAGFDHCIDKIHSFATLDHLLRTAR